MKREVVYFVTGGGKTKIGWTYERDPVRCLMKLQCGSPVLLTFVHHTNGGQALERSIHRMLKDRHSHSEWFHGEITKDEAKRIVINTPRAVRERRVKSAMLLKPVPLEAKGGKRFCALTSYLKARVLEQHGRVEPDSCWIATLQIDGRIEMQRVQ